MDNTGKLATSIRCDCGGRTKVVKIEFDMDIQGPRRICKCVECGTCLPTVQITSDFYDYLLDHLEEFGREF